MLTAFGILICLHDFRYVGFAFALRADLGMIVCYRFL